MADTTPKQPPAAQRRGRPRASEVAAQLGEIAALTALPTARPDADGLTLRQRRILEMIRQTVERRGYPPSIREMGDAVGLASSSSVAHQLKVLEAKGSLRRDPNRPRALEVLLPGPSRPVTRSLRTAPVGYDETGIGDAHPEPVNVPVLGRIAAGGPILAEERIEDVFRSPVSWWVRAPCSPSRSSRLDDRRSHPATGAGGWCPAVHPPPTGPSSRPS